MAARATRVTGSASTRKHEAHSHATAHRIVPKNRHRRHLRSSLLGRQVSAARATRTCCSWNKTEKGANLALIDAKASDAALEFSVGVDTSF